MYSSMLYVCVFLCFALFLCLLKKGVGVCWVCVEFLATVVRLCVLFLFSKRLLIRTQLAFSYAINSLTGLFIRNLNVNTNVNI